jgi:hypothetical protein
MNIGRVRNLSFPFSSSSLFGPRHQNINSLDRAPAAANCPSPPTVTIDAWPQPPTHTDGLDCHPNRPQPSSHSGCPLPGLMCHMPPGLPPPHSASCAAAAWAASTAPDLDYRRKKRKADDRHQWRRYFFKYFSYCRLGVFVNVFSN